MSVSSQKLQKRSHSVKMGGGRRDRVKTEPTGKVGLNTKEISN